MVATDHAHDDRSDISDVSCCLLQLISQEHVQRELSALEKRLRGLTEQQRPAVEAESFRLRLALLQQAQFLPEDSNVGQAC